MFSSGGVADMGFKKTGIKFIAANELIPSRAELYTVNHPESTVFNEDIDLCMPQFISTIKNTASDIFLLLATPPCQGMSSNGLGTLLKGIRTGKKPPLDPRNRLFMPAVDVIKAIKPKWVIFENVINMKNTVVEMEDGTLENILVVLKKTMPKEYVGSSYQIEFADYGLPQNRKRLITIYSNDKNVKKKFEHGTPLVPPKTHSKFGKNGLKKWIPLKKALANIEKLDARDKPSSTSKKYPFHRVGILDSRKYLWVLNTKENSTAFDNQCINPECMFDGNPTHGTIRTNNINQSKKNTPLFCVECGSQLPRPSVKSGNSERIMRGFTSAYKRMSKNAPAPTLTTNFSYVCSDKKIHPTENRPLSIHEACILQSISDYDYKWKNKNGQYISDSIIRDVVGESAPPMFFEKLLKWFTMIMCDNQRVVNTQ